MSYNPLLLTDVYKMGHMEQYPADTVEVYSYLEARKPNQKVTFFGLQYILIEYLSKPIKLRYGEEFLYFYEEILGKASEDVKNKIKALCELGYWPLEIKAVPEGTNIESKNILLSIKNTHPDFYWCVGFVESLLLKVWYPSTVATASKKYYDLVTKYADLTCDDRNHIPFQVHDFGYRGVSSEESAMMAGAAHLIKFSGSDTVPANWFLNEYYQAKGVTKGLSVPASEHSVMCSYGREGEYKAFDRMLELYPEGIVSIVSDTYDYYKILTDWATANKERIMKRNGKVVFRPDSGDPETVICGTGEPVNTPYDNGSLETLWNIFGGTENSKGYRVLDSHVGLIYGDGMYYERFEKILEHIKNEGFATSNLVIGVGGILLQNHNRDEFSFSLKATRIVRKDGQHVEIYKDPATDPSKKSKRGLMRLYRGENGYVTRDQVSDEEEAGDTELKTVFKDGKCLQQYSLQEIRGKRWEVRMTLEKRPYFKLTGEELAEQIELVTDKVTKACSYLDQLSANLAMLQKRKDDLYAEKWRRENVAKGVDRRFDSALDAVAMDNVILWPCSKYLRKEAIEK